MNDEGEAKGFGLLEIGGQVGQIQAMANWDYQIGSSGNVTSSIVNFVGQHLSLLYTINHSIKTGDVIPNGDYNPPFAVSLYGIFLPSAPMAASNTLMHDNRGSTFTSRAAFPLPVLSEAERANPRNYFTYNYNNSDMATYKDYSKPFIIERGDEVRVTYVVPQEVIIDGQNTSNNSLTKKTITQDFTVLGYRQPAPNLFFPSPSVTHQDGTVGVPADGETCLATSSQLASEGIYSQGELFKRYTKMIENNIPIIGGSQGSDTLSSAGDWYYSGSLLSVSKIDSDKIAISFEVHGSPTLQYTSATSSFTMGSSNNMVRTGLAAPIYVNELSASMGPLFQTQLSDPSAFLASLFLYKTTDPAFNFNMLEVTPDPAKLAIPIPNGIIHSYTIKKRVEADDRVVVNLTQPSGSRGVITPSGDGYIIPEDLTPIQQGNVQKLINKLKSENVFTKDSPNNTVR